MKSVEEYINEKHNFIFGGKSGLTGKEYGDGAKTFGELEKGDKIYLCTFNNFNIKSYRSDIFEFREKEVNAFDNGYFMNGRWESGGQPVIYVIDKNLEKDYFVAFIRAGEVFTRVYSTYEMTPEEALEIAEEEWKLRNKK